MAIFKLVIEKRYAKFFVTYYEATEKPSEEKQHETLEDVRNFVKKTFEKLGKEDSIIFRNIAYSNIKELDLEIKKSKY